MPEQIEQKDEIGLEKKNRKLFNRVIGVFFVGAIAVAAYFVGIERGRIIQTRERKNLPIEETIIFNKDPGKENSYLDFSLYWQVWDILKEKYVDSNRLDANKLFYGSIKGMLAATGDPYTTFFDPEENKKFHQEIKGSFEGIGAEVGMKNGVITIIAPLDDSPAQKAGIRSGDKILKVGDRSTAEMTIEEAVDLMRGTRGTQVVLTVFHEGDTETQEITITRDLIQIKSVKSEIKESDIAYIQISQFGDETEKEFNLAIKNVINNQTRGLVLDLRDNPGGYLDSSVRMASRMIPVGKVVVVEESGDGKQNKLYTRGGDVLSHLKTVVIINEGSASASEILAGALRDNRDNVTLVGEHSFGKGSVQEFVDLPEDTAVKITVAKWLTPKGDQINEKGITPDVEIKITKEDFESDRDPQLDEALKMLSQ
jgi:carboxyl-terminal processing protease